ncbi:GNAT family N-acetyltransferase [Colwellia sp. E2M01]|uniref:GNAT family N-acetyltransferase n=1 Tax=Colwellia sp. E2M01 TaxID=2841561 RepID=UPI001C09C14B|nr:GNAT family N-acetyltransferase [Colwellia sp. E2M01]MBU2870374.1 GNAT family N-acetyltransferase [Colwellia sp. E2M01]
MIEAVSKENIKAVLPLIRAYQEFYQVADICDNKNAEFFSQFNQSSQLGCQFMYKEQGEVVGFATVYFSYASSIIAKVAILNDLYTLPKARGKGVGKKLIEHCQKYAAANNAARLQWVTAPDNQAAQKLYDAMNTKKSTWNFYTYNGESIV